MGSVGDFLFGGAKSKESGNESSQSSNQSSQQSQSTSSQNSTNISGSQQVSGSQSQNLAYPALASALTPSLGYVSAGGNMLGALLGLPQSNFEYNGPTSINQPLLPTNSGTGGITVNDLKEALPQTPTPAPNPTPTPSPTPRPTPNPSPSTSTPVNIHDLIGSYRDPGVGRRYNGAHISYRANGGPVTAGQPYVVGENQPEVFVPETNGTIVPSVTQATNSGIVPYPNTNTQAYNPSPGNASDAVNTYANSAGLGFVLDQGQKALSGASASNGVFNSGATGKALVQYGQNLGKTYLNDYMNRLLDYSKLGLGSASALSGAGATSINQSAGTSGSVGTSTGQSQSTSSGSSVGSSTGTKTSDGTSHTKKGLL